MFAAHMRFAAETAEASDQLRARRVLNLVQRAIVLGDTENLWHPVYVEVDPWQFARHHTN